MLHSSSNRYLRLNYPLSDYFRVGVIALIIFITAIMVKICGLSRANIQVLLGKGYQKIPFLDFEKNERSKAGKGKIRFNPNAKKAVREVLN